MIRYAKLYFLYIKRSIIGRLEYKSSTFIALLSFILSNALSILSIYFILDKIGALQGWTVYQLGFLYGFSMLPVALDHIFTDELWLVAYRRCSTGDVDRYFFKPVPAGIRSPVMTFSFNPCR